MIKDLNKYQEKNQATLASKGYRGLNLLGKIKFFTILQKNNSTLKKFEKAVFKHKECYIGPFIGEFGNFLLHILPYLSYLNRQGIKINYCGLELHRPFLIDDKGTPFINNFIALRDFFKEVKPSGNNIERLPDDVQKIVTQFLNNANTSPFPLLDIFNNRDLYWYSYRNWQLNKRQYIYNLSNSYSTKKENKVVLFPRKMTKKFTANNGGNWDYNQLGEKLTNYFDEVVFVGHPELSDNNKVKNNKIRYAITGDNKDVLEECASAQLIITQHSGAMHVGSYIHTPVLLIFKGNPPIKGLDDSIRFRKNFKFNDVNIAFNKDEIIDFCVKQKKKTIYD
ncbi:MAG: hypothetical protein N4A35_07360 [Flavobacteriales bacterium]|jgi:hypothetical protein|nr:hypothetical protein [Flavobacteriales bacterium]